MSGGARPAGAASNRRTYRPATATAVAHPATAEGIS